MLSELELKKSELKKLHSSLQRYSQRISEVPKQKSEAQKRLKKITDQLTELPAESESRDEAKLLQLAIRTATSAEVEMLSVESRYLELSSQLSPVRIDLTNHYTKQLEAQYRELTKAVESARQREVEQQIQLALEHLPFRKGEAGAEATPPGLLKYKKSATELSFGELMQVTSGQPLENEEMLMQLRFPSSASEEPDDRDETSMEEPMPK